MDYRTNDAVITICQNNKTKTITITDVNEAAKEITGFGPIDIVGRPLDNILPPRIAELLKEYVEFEDDANDVGAVLNKVQSFSILFRNGTENGFRVKLVRLSSTTSQYFFALVLQNQLGARKNEAIRKTIQENFKGHESLDFRFDIPSRESLIKNIAVMKRYSKEMLSCCAVLQVDNYDKLLAQYGDIMFNELFKHTAFITKRSLRPDDVVGYIGDGRLGIMLIDITAGSQRLVLNRLRWQIASNAYSTVDKKVIGISVSISFCDINDAYSDSETIRICEKSLDALGIRSQNTLIDAAA